MDKSLSNLSNENGSKLRKEKALVLSDRPIPYEEIKKRGELLSLKDLLLSSNYENFMSELKGKGVWISGEGLPEETGEYSIKIIKGEPQFERIEGWSAIALSPIYILYLNENAIGAIKAGQPLQLIIDKDDYYRDRLFLYNNKTNLITYAVN